MQQQLKSLAIFDAFEILNKRIQEEEAMLEGKAYEEKKRKETTFKGFAEGKI